MKKILIIGVLILITAGCKTSNNSYEKELKVLVDNYYDKYIVDKIDNLNEINITLGELRELSLDDKILNKCSDDTKIIATIKENKIVSYKYKLKCN